MYEKEMEKNKIEKVGFQQFFFFFFFEEDDYMKRNCGFQRLGWMGIFL